ncbi:MAG: multicomponent Na+:H+ antiporter subunit [Thermotogota bacterium]|nr:multicomponent Na+:H+ antiporter subunit [Thermotogota bacterium]
MNLYTFTSLLLIAIGVYGLLSQRHLFKMLVSLSVLELGVNILLVSIGYSKDGVAPILTPPEQIINPVDPLPQALVLTAIVIGVGTTALMSIIIVKIYKRTGTLDLSSNRGEDE